MGNDRLIFLVLNCILVVLILLGLSINFGLNFYFKKQIKKAGNLLNDLFQKANNHQFRSLEALARNNPSLQETYQKLTDCYNQVCKQLPTLKNQLEITCEH